jgi:membrane protein implicated in regulation of membrane protease activity
MNEVAWILWLVLAVGLMIAEIFTLGFVLFWFGIGAAAAALISFFGFGFGAQFAAFAVVSVLLTAMSRTIFARYIPYDGGSRMKSAIDGMPGKIGTVSSASKGALNEAAVKVFGSTWTAYPIEGETSLVEGEKVEVVEVKGSSIYVRRFVDELPEWRKG